jgi:FkbM family methyltransferase
MASASVLARRAARSAPLRRIVKSPPVQALVQTQRGARAVEGTTQFALAQLRGRRTPLVYALRDHPDTRVAVRHRSRDVAMLNEIFGGTGGRLAYEVPDGIAPLPQGSKVLDLGGNVGLFALYAKAAWSAGEVRSFEPDPSNFGVLERARVANRHADGFAWTSVQAAVSNCAGTLRFSAGHASESRLSLGPDETAIDVAVVDIFEEDHDVDLAKLDIEGGEWSILADPRFAAFGARRLVMEWHAYLCPAPDAHGTAQRLLREAGYTIVLDEPSAGGRNGKLWAHR